MHIRRLSLKKKKSEIDVLFLAGVTCVPSQVTFTCICGKDTDWLLHGSRYTHHFESWLASRCPFSWVIFSWDFINLCFALFCSTVIFKKFTKLFFHDVPDLKFGRNFYLLTSSVIWKPPNIFRNCLEEEKKTAHQQLKRHECCSVSDSLLLLLESLPQKTNHTSYATCPLTQ